MWPCSITVTTRSLLQQEIKGPDTLARVLFLSCPRANRAVVCVCVFLSDCCLRELLMTDRCNDALWVLPRCGAAISRSGS